jgi:hypothetical protein
VTVSGFGKGAPVQFRSFGVPHGVLSQDRPIHIAVRFCANSWAVSRKKVSVNDVAAGVEPSAIRST